MKTKEEIEQLAKQSNDERGIDSAKSMLEREYVLGYTNAYTQCQEDMADKKSYTIEEIERAIDKLPFSQVLRNTIKVDVINNLKK